MVKKYLAKKSYPYYRHRINRKFFGTLGFFILIIGVALYAIFASSIFEIKDVKVDGVEGIESVYVYNMLEGQFKRQGIFGVDSDEVEKFINKKVSDFKFVSLSKTFPSRIIVEVTKREYICVVYASNGTFVLGADSFVITATEVSDLPIIVYDKALDVGTYPNDAVLVSALLYLNPNYKILVQNDSLRIQLKYGGKVLLPKTNNPDEEVKLSNLLQKILQKYTIDNRKIELIDLRYSKPVIKYYGDN